MAIPKHRYTILRKSYEIISKYKNHQEILINIELRKSEIVEGDYIPKLYHNGRLIFYFLGKGFNWKEAYPKIQEIAKKFDNVLISTILVTPSSIDEWVYISYMEQILMSVGRTYLYPELATPTNEEEKQPHPFMSVNMSLYPIHEKLIEELFFAVGEKVIGAK